MFSQAGGRVVLKHSRDNANTEFRAEINIKMLHQLKERLELTMFHQAGRKYHYKQAAQRRGQTQMRK